MLQSIREKAHGWIAWVIFSFIALTFAMWGVHNYLQGSEDTSVVAKVNGKEISKAQVRNLAERLRQQHQARLGPQANINASLEKLIRHQALQALVQNAALLNAAEQKGFALDQAQILLTLRNIPDFQEDGQFSQSRFENMLRQANMTDEQFYYRVHQDMLIQQLQEQFANSSFVLDQEIKALAQLVNQQREIDYALINAGQFLDKVEVSDAEVEQFYLEHSDEFQIPEKVAIEYVTLKMDDLLGNIEVNEKELEQFYQRNIESFTEKPQWKISYILKEVDETTTDAELTQKRDQLVKLKQQLNQGADFAKLAKQHSDDVMTRADGGSMGWVKPGVLDSSFEKVVVDLAKPGQISEPARTQYGLVVVKLDDLKKAVVKPLTEVNAQVKQALKAHKSEKIYAEASETFANLSFEQPDSLQPVADALNLKVETSDYFARQGAADGIAQYPAVVRTAFSEDVLTGGNNSEVIQANPETLVVIRLKDFQAAKVQPLAEVKVNVVKRLKADKALIAAREFGQQLQQDLAENRSAVVDKKLADIKTNWQHKPLIRFAMDRQPSETDEFQDKVYALPRPSDNKPVIAGIDTARGYVLVKLKSVQLVEPAADKREQQQQWLRQIISHRYQYMVRDIYSNSLVSQANVDIQERYLNEMDANG